MPWKGSALHELLRLPRLWRQNQRAVPPDLRWRRVEYGKHPRQYCLHIPTSSKEASHRTAVLFFHGGGWRFGRPEQFLVYAAFFAARGYPTLLPSVRRLPGVGFGAMRDDLAMLMRALDQAELAVDALIVGGMSSGGHLAAHLLLDRQLPAGLPVRAGFFLAAPLDLEPLVGHWALRSLTGASSPGERRRANPLQLLKEGEVPPMFVAHGRRDRVVPYRCSENFYAAASRMAPDRVRMLSIARGSHLDATNWLHEDDELRRALLPWLAERAVGSDAP